MVSIKSLLLGSWRVIVLLASLTLIIKVSPPVGIMEWAIPVLYEKDKFKGSFDAAVYTKLWSDPEFTTEVKLPLAWPINVFAAPEETWTRVDVIIDESVDKSSVNTTTGLFIFTRFNLARPLDSASLDIPSLSISKSMLSIIPSLSKSAGHLLMFTLGESSISNGSPVQSK